MQEKRWEKKRYLDIELLREGEGKESRPEIWRGKANGELVSIGEKWNFTLFVAQICYALDTPTSGKTFSMRSAAFHCAFQ